MELNHIVLILSYLAVFALGWFAARRIGTGPRHLSSREREVAIALINHLIRETRSAIDELDCHNPAIYVSLSGNEPDERLLQKIEPLGYQLKPCSTWKHGRGVLIFIHGIAWRDDGAALVQAGYVSGPSTANESTYVLKEQDRMWIVLGARARF